jgi:hypothetical protein
VRAVTGVKYDLQVASVLVLCADLTLKLLAVSHIAGETFGDTFADSVLLTPDGTRAGELHLWAVFDLD